jgi:hypothetical protein
MKQEVRFFHCNEREEVIEIESYVEENGAIISQKETTPGQNQPFSALRSQLEQAGWQVGLAGTTRVGHSALKVNSYIARRPIIAY